MTQKSSRKGILILTVAAVLLTAVMLSAGALLSEDTHNYSLYKQAEKGNAAVADFNLSNGMTVYSGNGIRSEFYTDYGTVYQYSDADEEIFRGNADDGLFISGTYDNSTVVFYVKETDSEVHAAKIITQAVDEAEFFAGIKSDNTASSVSMAVCDGETVKWRPVISQTTSDTVSTELYYGDCPFDVQMNAYMVALRVDSGMTCFDSLELTGLELIQLKDSKKDLYYDNGVLMEGLPDGGHSKADALLHFNYELLREITACERTEEEIIIDFSAIAKLLQNIYAFIIKVTQFLSAFFG